MTGVVDRGASHRLTVTVSPFQTMTRHSRARGLAREVLRFDVTAGQGPTDMPVEYIPTVRPQGGLPGTDATPTGMWEGTADRGVG